MAKKPLSDRDIGVLRTALRTKLGVGPRAKKAAPKKRRDDDDDQDDAGERKGGGGGKKTERFGFADSVSRKA